MILFELEKTESFDLGEGWYRMILLEAREREKMGKSGYERTIRFVFEVISVTDPCITYKAGKDYRAKSPQALSDDLKAWLGADLASIITKDGKIDLKSLEGREADVEVVHIANERFENPFCYIRAIRPPGSIVKDFTR